jgi:uncharacterized protein (TIGR02246 family)
MPDNAADEAAIRDLVERYCDAAARNDLDAFRTFWTPEARWTGPDLEREGIYAIVSAFGKMRARVASAQPTIVGGSVTVDGDRATGWWEIREHIMGHDGAERDTVGRYDDEYARTKNGWRFTRRHFTPSRG